MTLKDVLHRRDDALMEILDRLKGKKLYNNLWVQLKFFWQESKREIYCATPWKPADGDDLPEIDREVIVLYQPYHCEGNEYVVGFAHRPKEYWDGRNIDTDEVTRYYPKRYDKGGWNIPDVKWWLDSNIEKLNNNEKEEI